MKNRRHSKIIDIISEYQVETQEELLDRLRQEGFDVTQATVSRDIRELKLVKTTNDEGGYQYAFSVEKNDNTVLAKYANILRQAVLKVDYAANIVVVKTYSGMAQAAAAAIDNMGWSEIIGTVAGDDTIIIVVRGEDKAVLVCKKFNELIR